MGATNGGLQKRNSYLYMFRGSVLPLGFLLHACALGWRRPGNWKAKDSDLHSPIASAPEHSWVPSLQAIEMKANQARELLRGSKHERELNTRS